jgi:dTDP-glucose 4,6-dehydratase
MKIFVTGGAGFIGSNFIRHVLALDRGYSIVNYDKLTYAGNLGNLISIAKNPNYHFQKGDICNTAAVEAAMAGCDTVVHFAAESHVDRSIYEPAPVIETNVTGTFVLLQVARKLNVQKFVHVSTDEVYGDLHPGTFAHEESPLQPSSPYRLQSKLRSPGPFICADIWISSRHHASIEQLWPVSIPGEISAANDHQCAE